MSSERDAVKTAYDRTRDAAKERALDAKLEKSFRSHRDVPNRRNFHTWNHQFDKAEEEAYRDNFDRIFPNSPGAEF